MPIASGSSGHVLNISYIDASFRSFIAIINCAWENRVWIKIFKLKAVAYGDLAGDWIVGADITNSAFSTGIR